jgi:uncharacterized protein CbrC (UPF0167 family)
MSTMTAEHTTERILGSEITDGMTVYVTGRWQVLSNVRPAGPTHFRADTDRGGSLLGNAESRYDVRRSSATEAPLPQCPVCLDDGKPCASADHPRTMTDDEREVLVSLVRDEYVAIAVDNRQDDLEAFVAEARSYPAEIAEEWLTTAEDLKIVADYDSMPDPDGLVAAIRTAAETWAREVTVEALVPNLTTRRIAGAEIRNGDIVFVTGRWQTLTEVELDPDGAHFLAATARGGEVYANARSMYDVKRA